MPNNVLDSYLISIGYDIDKASQDKFKTAVREGAFEAQAHFAALEAMATKLGSVAADAAEQLNQLYNDSKFYKDTAANIALIRQAAAKVGLSTQQAEGAFKSFATAIATNPGLNARAAAMSGVDPAKWDGLPTSEKLKDFLQALKKQPAYVQQAIAGDYGIDYQTFLRMSDPEFIAGIQLAQDIASSIGVNFGAAAQGAHAFMSNLIDIGTELDDINKSVGAKVFGQLNTDLGAINKFMEMHGKEIATGFGDIGTSILLVIGDVGKLGSEFSIFQRWIDMLKIVADQFKIISSVVDDLAHGKLSQALHDLVSGGATLGHDIVAELTGKDAYASGQTDGGAAGADGSGGEPGGGVGGWIHDQWTKLKSHFGGGAGVTPRPSGGVGHWWTPERQAHAVDRLEKEAGLSETGARALLARWAFVEARGGPTSANDIGGGHYGIGQWSRSRGGSIWGNPDYDAQLGLAIHELNTTESRARKMLQSNDPTTAAIGSSQYERAEGYNAGTGADAYAGRVLSPISKITTPTQLAAKPPEFHIHMPPMVTPADAGEAHKRMVGPYGDLSGSYGAFDHHGYAAPLGNNITHHNDNRSEFNTKTEINVYASENEEIGSHVARVVNGVNQRLTRNMTNNAVG